MHLHDNYRVGYILYALFNSTIIVVQISLHDVLAYQRHGDVMEICQF